MHDRCTALHADQWELLPKDLVQAFGARFHLVALAQVLVTVQVEVCTLRYQSLQRGLVGAGPLHIGDAAEFGSFRLAEFVPLPNGDMLVGLAHKKDLAVLRVHSIREHQKHALLLVDTREVHDIRGLLERHAAIRAGGHDVVAMEDAKPALIHCLTEA